MKVVIEDEGGGFNIEDLPNPTEIDTSSIVMEEGFILLRLWSISLHINTNPKD
jgi:hypothetical protein